MIIRKANYWHLRQMCKNKPNNNANLFGKLIQYGIFLKRVKNIQYGTTSIHLIFAYISIYCKPIDINYTHDNMFYTYIFTLNH